VSAGVALAAVLNFLLMLRLSVRSLGLSWSAVSGLYLRHLAIGAGVTWAAMAAAGAARHAGLPGVLVVLAIAAAAATAWAALVSAFPRLITDDLRWTVDLVRHRLLRPARARR
jgi:hypothetical protein